MEAKAKARFLRMSARKIRRVANLIKGKKVDEALDVLAFIPKVAAVPLEKTIRSATANALSVTGTAKLKAEDLYIKRILIDGGPIMKRIRPTGMGRAFRIRKRTSHITIFVADESAPKPESE
jgi:large subunit ribosomal protein L22